MRAAGLVRAVASAFSRVAVAERVLCGRSKPETPKHYRCTRTLGHVGACSLLYTPGKWRRVVDVLGEIFGEVLTGGRES